MRSSPLPVLALLALVAASATTSLGAPPAPPQTRAFAFDVVAVPCALPDGVCLAYGGALPGPTLDVNLGDRVQVTMTNRIAETLPATTPAALRARLETSPVSFHTHGIAVSAAKDGVAAHSGTQLIGSAPGPGETFVYEFRAAFAGLWHYHDHVLGQDGAEGTLRGLYGTLVVRGAAEPRPDALLDLHVHDNGVNTGTGLAATVAAGSDVEIDATVLGNLLWTVSVERVGGASLGSALVGPGMSERFWIEDAQPGSYRWTARWGLTTHTGLVTVV